MTARTIRNAATALAFVAACGFAGFLWSQHKSLTALQAAASNRLALSSATLFAPTDKYSYLPALVSSHAVVSDVLVHQDDSARVQNANIFLEHLNASAGTAVIYLLNAEGETIAASNWRAPQSFVGQNYAYRPYFQDAIKGGTGRFYGMGTTSLLPGYYISHPVTQDGAIIGVAVVKIDMSKLDEGWHDQRDEIIVADGNGVIFLSSRPDWKYRPLSPLSETAAAQLKRTRQYDAVLRQPLGLQVAERIRDDEQIVRIPQQERNNRSTEARYFLKIGALPASDWKIGILVPMTEVEGRTKWVALGSAGTAALLVVSLLFAQQLRIRSRERERSRAALEQAHEALAQKHSELQKVSEELRLASITDPLTGAYNRRFFFEAAPKLISSAVRHGFPLTVMAIDVDHFKRINDLYGHPAGDRVLMALTRLCKETLREADVFARYGGEEFIVALPNTAAEEAKNVAERLRTRIAAEPFEVNGESLSMTVSCGVSQFREEERDIGPALKRADDALYAAKRGGRDRVVLR